MKLLAVYLTLLVSFSAFASSSGVLCVDSESPEGEGYSVIVTSKMARLFLDSKPIAKIKLTAKQPGVNDQEEVHIYSQNKSDAFQIKYSSGGIANLRSAKVLRGGVAGFTPLANLDSCHILTK